MSRLLVVVAVALLAAGAAQARNPRLEQLALTKADMTAATAAVLRVADLGTGWTGGTQSPNDNSAPDCTFQDYSRYTITGQAQTHFAQSGASIVSRVELYKSKDDATGDFAVDTHPRTAACEGKAIRDGFASEAKGMTVALTSATQLTSPKLGDRAVSFRIVLTLHQGKKALKLYIDLIGFVRGRATASVIVVAPGSPAQGAVQLARIIDARLNKAA